MWIEYEAGCGEPYNKPWNEYLAETRIEDAKRQDVADRLEKAKILRNPETGWHVKTGEELKSHLDLGDRAITCWATHLPVLEAAARDLGQSVAESVYLSWESNLRDWSLSVASKANFSHSACIAKIGRKGYFGRKTKCFVSYGRYTSKYPLHPEHTYVGSFSNKTLLYKDQEKCLTKQARAALIKLGHEYVEKRLTAFIEEKLDQLLETYKVPSGCVSVTLQQHSKSKGNVCSRSGSKRIKVAKWTSTVKIHLPNSE